VIFFLLANDVAGDITDVLDGDQRMRPFHDKRGPGEAAKG